ncbi:hypothetical protein BRD05_05200 [Halobacteriales archaeon QS_9_70_65]|nr:MAG: hypothetical protein BRD05_05200 [Halobacteriales archaeon QS_9_70_65]
MPTGFSTSATPTTRPPRSRRPSAPRGRPSTRWPGWRRRAADDTTLAITAGDCALPAAEREVLTGDIELDRVRHAQGLGVRNVYWHV